MGVAKLEQDVKVINDKLSKLESDNLLLKKQLKDLLKLLGEYDGK